METKTPNLSPYDFLGYLVPGLAACALLDISYCFHILHEPLTLEMLSERYGGIPWQSAVPLVLMAYYLGHIVSFLSSISIERHAMWLHGHPTDVLLYGAYRQEVTWRASYFGVGGGNAKLSLLLRVLILIFMHPIAVIELVFGNAGGLNRNYFRPLDSRIRAGVQTAVSDLCSRLGIEADRDDEYKGIDYPRLGFHYALETAPAHVANLRNYVLLYGFLRSMTFTLLLAYWVYVVHILLLDRNPSLLVPLAFLAIWIFASYAAFAKFWVRYHRESLMAITAVYAKNRPPSAPVSATGSDLGTNPPGPRVRS